MLLGKHTRQQQNGGHPVDHADPPACFTQVVNGMFSTTTGRIDDRWRRFMQFQIKRTRDIFASAEAGVDQLAPDARLPVW